MKYKVNKTVVAGVNYIEHNFKKYPENFVGTDLILSKYVFIFDILG